MRRHVTCDVTRLICEVTRSKLTVNWWNAVDRTGQGQKRNRSTMEGWSWKGTEYWERWVGEDGNQSSAGVGH